MVPLLVFTALVLVAAIAVPIVSTLLGRTTHNPHKDIPYESGIMPTGGAHLRMGVPYYLVAIFFILFDVEVALLFPWAPAARALGWAGFLKAFVFLVFVFAGLVYIWLRGGLIWRHHLRTASKTTLSSQS